MDPKAAKATEETLQAPTPFESLPQAAQRRVEELAVDINIEDARSVLQYGVPAQMRISEFAEQVLTQVRAKNVGQVREHLGQLLARVKNLDFDRASEPAWIARVPLLRRMTSSQQALIGHYERVSIELDRLVPDLNAACAQLLKDVGFFDNLYARNLEHLKELDAFIIAGERKLAELAAEDRAVAERGNGASADPRVAEGLRDRRQRVDCFVKRMQHLKMARMISLQLAPQIRLIQDDLKVLVEETQNTVLTTIPLWKNQIVVAVGLLRQKETLLLQQHATQATSAMLKMNSDLIRSSNRLVRSRESEKSAVERATLSEASNDLIGGRERDDASAAARTESGPGKRADATTETAPEPPVRRRPSGRRVTNPSANGGARVTRPTPTVESGK